jgi:hypothetical protein
MLETASNNKRIIFAGAPRNRGYHQVFDAERVEIAAK